MAKAKSARPAWRGQRLADQRQGAHVEAHGGAAVRGRHAVTQPATGAQAPHQRARQFVDLGFGFVRMGRQGGDLRRGPVVERRGQRAVVGLEERPGEE